MSAELERFLQIGVKAIRSGNTVAARGLFRALTREYPHDPRTWLGLAGSTTDRDEQRYALEQVVALDPHNVNAQQGLARLNAALPPALDLEPATQPAPPPPEPIIVETPPEPIPEPPPIAVQATPAPEDPDAGHFPLLNRIAVGGILLLALVLLLVLFWPRNPPPQTATPAAPTAILAGPTLPAATTLVTTDASLAPTTIAAATSEPVTESATRVPLIPTLTPVPATLPLGAILEVDGWLITLLRPDYALVLDGAIGELQPDGRFVLALMAISNGTSEPRFLPTDLFVLTDSAQRSYTPLPNASTIYLATYGQDFGDQAFEEIVAAQSGILSIPLLFDVPLDASDLMLTLRSGPGWPITGGDTTNAGP
jgi:hypothetical protein